MRIKVFAKISYKKFVYLILLPIVFFLFAPSADGIEIENIPVLGWIVNFAGNTFATAALAIPTIIAYGFFTAGIGFLNLSLSIYKTSSITGMDNAIVSAGFATMQGFGNAILVIALIFTGLATLLRIEEYRAQRNFPRIIIMLLLINFSRVITGWVVDISQIIMDFFAQNLIGWDSLLTPIKSVLGGIQDIGHLFKSLDLTGSLVATLVYCAIGGIISFIFAFLFLFRFVALSVLTVLSPVAFASYVMPGIDIPNIPGVRKFWDWWLKQLLEWAFLGVTAAFFLFLANQFLSASVTQSLAPQSMVVEPIEKGVVLGANPVQYLAQAEPISQPPRGVFQTLLPYFGAILMMILALQFSFTSAAVGAGIVAKMGAMIGGIASTSVMKGGGGLMTRAMAKAGTSATVQKVATGMENLMRTPLNREARKRSFPSWLAKSTLAGLLAPAYFGSKTWGKYARKQTMEDISQEEERLKDQDPERLAKRFYAPTTLPSTKIAIMHSLARRGQIGALRQALQAKGVEEAEIDNSFIRTIGFALAVDPKIAFTLLKTSPHLFENLPQVAKNRFGEQFKVSDISSLMRKIRPEEIGAIDPKAYEEEKIKEFFAGVDENGKSTGLTQQQASQFLVHAPPPIIEKVIGMANERKEALRIGNPLVHRVYVNLLRILATGRRSQTEQPPQEPSPQGPSPQGPPPQEPPPD